MKEKLHHFRDYTFSSFSQYWSFCTNYLLCLVLRTMLNLNSCEGAISYLIKKWMNKLYSITQCKFINLWDTALTESHLIHLLFVSGNHDLKQTLFIVEILFQTDFYDWKIQIFCLRKLKRKFGMRSNYKPPSANCNLSVIISSALLNT